MTTPTTDTKRCPHCGAELDQKFPSMGEEIYKCGTWNRVPDNDRTDLCREREAHNKTRKELKILNRAWKEKCIEAETLRKHLSTAESLLHK